MIRVKEIFLAALKPELTGVPKGTKQELAKKAGISFSKCS
jgi:hypothetical protein